MFGVLKVVFYTFVAVSVGVFLGTVPVGGRTIAERVSGTYQSKPARPAPASPARPARVEPAPAHPAVRKSPRAPAAGPTAMAQAPTTAGAANAPDGHSDNDEKALERLIAARSKPR